MPHKRPTKEEATAHKRPTDQGEWRPPRGIAYEFTPGRAMPFRLRWRVNGERKSMNYATAEIREREAKRLAKKKETDGSTILSFDPKRWAIYEQFQRIVGEDTDPLLVAHEWLASRGRGASEGQNTPQLTVKQAVENYLALRLAEDIRQDSDTHRHLKKHLAGRLVEAFGPLPLRDLTADMLRVWLAGLAHKDTKEAFSNLTKRHHRKDVNTFLKRAVREGWIRLNPCENVVPPKIDDEDTTVIRVCDAFALLKANRDQPIIGRLALEMFGGLRCSSVERLSKEHILWPEKGIRMPGQKHKSGKAKFRQGHPEILWQWLKHAPEECWTEISEKNYDRLKGDAFKRAGVVNPGNVLRHSFASYLLAKEKDMPRVGYLMQHTRTSTTQIYEGVATEADAALYLSLTPAAVKGEWDAFAKRSIPT